ncbi:MAG: EamA family transporter [Tannerella sp.]|jgi:inner membrane transporter RhtA|nr:EamA family transporter [Tannerella sp.]
MAKTKKWAIPAVFLSMISMQGGASIAKYLFPILGPAGTSTLRLGFAGIALAIINRPRIWKFRRKEWTYSLAYGFTIGAMILLFYFGIQRIPLGLGVTVEFIGPLGLALLTSRKMSDFIWAILAGIGIILIVPWDGDSVDIVGLLFVFAAGLLWALYIVIGGEVTKKVKGPDIVTVGMCFATLVALPFAFYYHDLDNLDVRLLVLGLGVGILSSALPFSLDLVALKWMPAKTFSVLQSLQPAFGALSGLIFLGEILLLKQWIAIVCVVFASMGATIGVDWKRKGK